MGWSRVDDVKALVVNTVQFRRTQGFTVISATPEEAVFEGGYRPDLLQGGILTAISAPGAPLWRRHADRRRY